MTSLATETATQYRPQHSNIFYQNSRAILHVQFLISLSVGNSKWTQSLQLEYSFNSHDPTA